MAKPIVELYHSFNEWRIKTNELSNQDGDLATLYNSDGLVPAFLEAVTRPTDLVIALNDLNNRKVKRSGDFMTGGLEFNLGTITTWKPVIDADIVWNNALVDHSGIFVDIVNTASGAGSLLLDFRLAGVKKFGVDAFGGIIQKLTGTFMARDIVSGSRHVREYQDLSDSSVNGLPATKFEWGYIWNGGWNGAAYVKDRSNIADHTLMHRIDNGYRAQYWFSDGTTAGSPISFIKKIDFDFPADTAWFDLTTTFTKNVTIGASKFTVNATSGDTLVGGTFRSNGATTLDTTLAVGGVATLNSLVVSTTTLLTGAVTTSAPITVNGGTVTVNTPLFTLNQTWNNSGTIFKGIVLNVTNTASSGLSSLFDITTNGKNRFALTTDGTINQFVSGTFLARDIVSKDLTLIPTARHIREYQDLDDGAVSTQGLDVDAVFEFGYSYNAKWDSTTNSYVKDDTGANMHGFNERFTEGYKKQTYFSDGTTPGSPIAWVKKIDIDFPNSTAMYDLATNIVRNFSVNTNKFTVAAATGNTTIAGSLTVSGAITGTLLGNASTVTNGVYSTGSYADPTWITSLNKTKVGLGSVENVALTTWAGNTSISSVGTITVGTWNATTISIAKGGTGLTATGLGNTLLGTVNATGALEYKTLTSVDGTLVFTHTAGGIDIKTSGIIPGTTTFQGDLNVGTPIKFTVAAATGNTSIAGTLTVAQSTILAATSVTALTAQTVSSPVVTIGDSVTDTVTLTTASIAAAVVDNIPVATYRSVCWEIQVVDAVGGKYQRVSINAIHNGTIADSVEFGVTAIGGLGATFTVDLVAGQLRLVATPTSVNSTVFKVRATAIKI